MADIYRTDFVMPGTGYPWRLEIYKGDISTPVPASPTIVDFQEDAIEDVGGVWEYDTIPLGMVAPIRLKMKWHLRQIPAELARWLLAPYATGSVTMYSPTVGGLSDVDLTVTSTNVVRLSVKFPGNAFYQLVYVGVQDPAVDGPKVPQDTLTLEMETEDVLRYAYKTVTMDKLSELARVFMLDDTTALATAKSRTCAIDYIYEANAVPPGGGSPVPQEFLIGNVVRGNNEANEDLSRFWFTRWSNQLVSGVMRIAVQRALKAILRTYDPSTGSGYYPMTDANTDAVVGFVLAFEGLKKQTYTDNPIAGADLTGSTTYCLWAVANQDEFLPTARIQTDIFKELGTLYASLWDLWADCVKSGYKVAQSYQQDAASRAYKPRIQTYDPAGEPVLPDAPLDLTEFLRGGLLDMYARNLKTVTGSTAARIESDQDKYDVVKIGARADRTYTVPVAFTPAPVAGAYELTQVDPNQNGQATRFYTEFAKEDGSISYGYAPRILSFYYFERVSLPTLGYALQKDEAIRACSWVPIKNQGETVTPPATAPTYPMPNVRYDQKQNSAVAVAIADQRQQGYISQTPLKIMDTFGKSKTAVVSGELPLDFGAYIDTGYGSHLFAFTPYLRRYTVDFALSSGLVYFDEVPPTFYMTKCEFDMKKGTAKVELYGVSA